MKTAWEQHNRNLIKKNYPKHVGPSWRTRDIERRSLMQPPDDFRQLRVMPEWDDVCSEIDPFLRPNVVKGIYPDVDTYLDVQFRYQFYLSIKNLKCNCTCCEFVFISGYYLVFNVNNFYNSVSAQYNDK